MTLQTPTPFAAAKEVQVPLAQIDVRGDHVANKPARIKATPAVPSVRAATFNSAL